MTSRRKFLAGIAGGAFAAALSGCGVPTSSKPTAVGKAPREGGGGDRAEARIPTTEGISSPQDLLSRFLQAPATGDVDPAARRERIERATRYARLFLTAEAGSEWQPGPQIVLVDVTDVRNGFDDVTATLQPVGVLNDFGGVDKTPDLAVDLGQLRFTVERVAGPDGGLRLTGKLPNLLMLSTDGLNDLFDVQPIYFWDPEYRYLVPDRRYMSRGVSREKRIKEVVDRLIRGPSEWLTPVVVPLPDGTTLIDLPVPDESKIPINLSSAVAGLGDRLRNLAWQLRWSLQSENLPVALRIDGREQFTEAGTDYREKNPALQVEVPESDRLYGVVDNKVVRLSGGQQLPVLAAAENAAVVTAAVSRGRRRDVAALVRQPVPDAPPELWVGRHDHDTPPRYVRVELPGAGVVGQPSYLPGVSRRFLVAAGGQLYDVEAEGTVRQVAVPASHGAGAVTAVAVAPDGRRLAMIAGGRALVFTVDPETAPVSLSTPRDLALGTLTNPQAVAWTLEHQVIVAGAAALVEVSVDNARRNPIAVGIDKTQLVGVACVPRSPIDGLGNAVIVETASPAGSYRVYTSGLEPVSIAVDPQASPSPSGKGTAQNKPVVRAPFYLHIE